LTFDLQVNAYQLTTLEYMCTKFGVDSSSLLEHGHTNPPTHTVTNATDHPIPCISYAGEGQLDGLVQLVQYF